MVYTIRRVVLEDFISHERTELELGEGITVLVGENGAGKSSIVDAIYYALTLDPKTIRGGRSNLVRRGSKTGRARVVVELEDGERGERLTIDALIPARGGGSVKVFHAGPGGARRLVASKVGEARRAIARSLGLEAYDDKTVQEIIATTIVLRQRRLSSVIDLFSSGQASKKREMLGRIFGLESYRRAREKLSELEVEVAGEPVRKTDAGMLEREIRRAKRRLEEHREKLRELGEEAERLEEQARRAEERLEAARRGLAEARRRLEESIQRREAVASRLEDALKRLEEKRRAREEHERLGCPGLLDRIRVLEEQARRLEDVHARLVDLEGRLAGLKAEAGEKERLYRDAEKLYNALERALQLYGGAHPRSVLREIDRLQERLSDAEKRRARIEGELEKLEEALGRLGEEARRARRLVPGAPEGEEELLDKARSLLDELRGRAERLRREAERLNAEATALERKAEEDLEKARLLSGGEERCPLCGRPLTPGEAEEIAKRLRREAAGLRGRAERLRREAAARREEADRLEGLARRLERAIERLSIALESVSRYGGPEAARRRLEGLRGELERLEEEIREARARYEELSKTKGEALRLAALLEEYGVTGDIAPGVVNSARERMERLRRELEEARSRIAVLEDERSALLGEASRILHSRPRGPGDVREWLERARSRLRRLEERRGECERLAAAMEGLEDLEREAERLKGELGEAEERVEEWRGKVERLEEELNGSFEELKELKNKLGGVARTRSLLEEEVERLRSQIGSLERMLWAARVLGVVEEVFKRAPEELYQRKLQLLEDIVSRVLAVFNTKYVEARIAHDGDDLRFVLSSREGVSADLAQVSGGEQTAFGIALVIALNKLLSGNIGFLVLDEPTEHLDEDKRRLIADVLRDLRKSRVVSQIVVVSHERHLIDAADTVYTVRYSAGRSVVEEMAPSLGEA